MTRAKIYNGSQIRPTDTNQTVGGFIKITCILDEGGFTVNSPNTVISDGGVLNAGYAYTFTTAASRLNKYDPVCLKINTGVTYAITEGRPVVCAPVADEGIFGYVLTEPKAMTALTQLTSTVAADTLAERLAGRYYRYAQVVLFCNMAEAKVTDGSTILVGSNLVYDASDEDYLVDATGDAGADGGDNMACVSAHYSATAEDNVLGLHGLHIVKTQA